MIRWEYKDELPKEILKIITYKWGYDLTFTDKLDESFGGDFFLVENSEDLDIAKSYLWDPDETEFTLDVYDLYENEWLQYCQCTNNAGGAVFWVRNKTVKPTSEQLVWLRKVNQFLPNEDSLKFDNLPKGFFL